MQPVSPSWGDCGGDQLAASLKAPPVPDSFHVRSHSTSTSKRTSREAEALASAASPSAKPVFDSDRTFACTSIRYIPGSSRNDWGNRPSRQGPVSVERQFVSARSQFTPGLQRTGERREAEEVPIPKPEPTEPGGAAATFSSTAPLNVKVATTGASTSTSTVTFAPLSARLLDCRNVGGTKGSVLQEDWAEMKTADTVPWVSSMSSRNSLVNAPPPKSFDTAQVAVSDAITLFGSMGTVL
ncbi:MAG: hypothetical protein BWX80_02450 [Candidatus Hydrogenedentes bacterium ADurb.Bin101]|nr:MAG: hypothetical protein BWX80_02450 [Candidatus Hydrogenedentes bacterium ADurb.Bin101]